MFKFINNCIENVQSAATYVANVFTGSVDLVRAGTIEIYTATQERAVRIGTIVSAAVMAACAPFTGPAILVVATVVAVAYVVPKVIFELLVLIAAIPVTIGTLVNTAFAKRKPTVKTVVADVKEIVENEPLVTATKAQFDKALAKSKSLGETLAAKAKAHAASKMKTASRK